MSDQQRTVRLATELEGLLTDAAIKAREILATLAGPPERLATIAEMEEGGWVRFPGKRAWRQIDSIAVGHPSQTCIHYRFGGVVYSEQVNPWDTLPYQTDAEFQLACDRERGAEDDAMDRMSWAEWFATAHNRGRAS